MKLELKENMYVRTKGGIIDKILKLNKSYVKGVSQKDELYAYDIDNIVKASYNIIDILEEGDYVNGCYIQEIKSLKDNVMVCMLDSDYEFTSTITNKDIKTIVTHEQMEQMAYKVGE